MNPSDAAAGPVENSAAPGNADFKLFFGISSETRGMDDSGPTVGTIFQWMLLCIGRRFHPWPDSALPASGGTSGCSCTGDFDPCQCSHGCSCGRSLMKSPSRPGSPGCAAAAALGSRAASSAAGSSSHRAAAALQVQVESEWPERRGEQQQGSNGPTCAF